MPVANSGKLREGVYGEKLARSRTADDKLVAMNSLPRSDLSPLVMPEEFPTIQGGGSLILAWQIRNKRVLVVGGGEVAPVINTLF